MSYTFYYISLWMKYMWKACKIFAYFLIATYLKIVVKRCMIIIYQKDPTFSSWYSSMTFTDFQWLFQAKCHFSGPTRNSMTFQGKIEIPWLLKARLKFHDFSRLVWTMCSGASARSGIILKDLMDLKYSSTITPQNSFALKRKEHSQAKWPYPRATPKQYWDLPILLTRWANIWTTVKSLI